MAITRYSFNEKLEIARTFHAFYIEKESLFYKYNPILFTQNWSIEWLNAIDQAETIEKDKNKVYQNMDTTAALQKTIKEASQNYQRFIKPYIEDAFMKDKSFPYHSFGIEDYAKIKKSVAEMLLFLSNLIDKTKKNQQALIEVGINDRKMSLLQEQYDRLTDLFIQKKTLEGERLQATLERKKVYAQLDFFTQKTAKAAKKIYDKTDPAYRFFMIYGKKD